MDQLRYSHGATGNNVHLKKNHKYRNTLYINTLGWYEHPLTSSTLTHLMVVEPESKNNVPDDAIQLHAWRVPLGLGLVQPITTTHREGTAVNH